MIILCVPIYTILCILGGGAPVALVGLLIERFSVRDTLEAGIFTIVNGVPLHEAFHYQSPIAGPNMTEILFKRT